MYWWEVPDALCSAAGLPGHAKYVGTELQLKRGSSGTVPTCFVDESGIAHSSVDTVFPTGLQVKHYQSAFGAINLISHPLLKDDQWAMLPESIEPAVNRPLVDMSDEIFEYRPEESSLAQLICAGAKIKNNPAKTLFAAPRYVTEIERYARESTPVPVQGEDTPGSWPEIEIGDGPSPWWND